MALDKQIKQYCANNNTASCESKFNGFTVIILLRATNPNTILYVGYTLDYRRICFSPKRTTKSHTIFPSPFAHVTVKRRARKKLIFYRLFAGFACDRWCAYPIGGRISHREQWTIQSGRIHLPYARRQPGYRWSSGQVSSSIQPSVGLEGTKDEHRL